MRRTGGLVLLALLVAVGGSAFAADGSVNFILGQRNLSDDFWSIGDLDTQTAFGVNADFGGDKWPVHIAVGLNLSAKSGTLFDAAIADLSLGAVWVPRKGKLIRPYLGVGVSSVGAAIDIVDDDDVDQSFGYYINGGVYFQLFNHFNVGIDVRLLEGTEFELFRSTFDANYAQAGIILGVGW